jgi:hypothetical protein
MGMGDEMIAGWFEADLNYTSNNGACRLSDPGAHVTMTQNFEATALAAINPVQAKASP